MLQRTNGADPLVEVSCLDAWWLAYSQPHAQHIARASLEREGFECWYPIRKVVTRRPASSLPSKTRHRRRFEVVERVEPVFGGYLFVRRLLGAYDIGLLYELPGVCGLCRVGKTIATIRDWEVELLRLAEANGRFNIYHASLPGAYRVAIEVDPRLAGDQQRGRYVGVTRWAGRLDDASRSMLFCEELGRVIRLCQEAPPGVAGR